jgi:thioredoxin 1
VSAKILCAMLLAPAFIFQTCLAPAWSAPVTKPNAVDKGAKKAGLPIVYDFYTSYCAPCKVIKPIFEAVENEYRGRVDMERIDAEDPKNKPLVDKYDANTYPLIVFVDAHGKRKGDFNRKVTKKELVERVEKLIAK